MCFQPQQKPQQKPAFRCSRPHFSHSQTSPVQDLVRELTGKQPQLPNKSTYRPLSMLPAPPAPAKTSIPLQRSSFFTLPNQSCAGAGAKAHWDAATAPKQVHLPSPDHVACIPAPAKTSIPLQRSSLFTLPDQSCKHLVRELTAKQPRRTLTLTWPCCLPPLP